MVNFVLYDVTGEIRKEGEPNVTVKVSGVCRDTPTKLATVFKQNPELLACDIVVSENYHTLLGGFYHGTYQET